MKIWFVIKTWFLEVLFLYTIPEQNLYLFVYANILIVLNITVIYNILFIMSSYITILHNSGKEKKTNELLDQNEI